MGTTVGISKEIRNALMALKFEEGYKNLDSLIGDLIAEHKKRKLLAASDLFRERMEKKGLTLEDLQ
jgi:cysteinyl-tRNA synthetase